MGLAMGIMREYSRLNRIICEQYPGVFAKGLKASIKERQAIIADEESVSEKIGILRKNRMLAEIVGHPLDMLYDGEKLEFYLANAGLFAASYVEYEGVFHSAEYIVSDLERNNFIVKEACVVDGELVLRCDEKKIDATDVFCPSLRLNPVELYFPADDAESSTQVFEMVIRSVPDNPERKTVYRKN